MTVTTIDEATTFRTLDDMGDVAGKRVLVRADLNVPVENGHIADASRIEAVTPTLRELAERGAKVIVLSHFGRPKGRRTAEASLEQVVPALAEALAMPVGFSPATVGPDAAAAIANMVPGEILVLENTRFDPGEEANDPAFVAALAENGDLYVNDAFSAAHRAHASTEGLAHRLPAFAGRAMEAELTHLEKALASPARPLVAVVGGAKVSTKIGLLESLVAQVDALVIGGGMANTFLAARGVEIGRSLAERDLGETARAILAAAERSGCRIVLPVDGVVAKSLAEGAEHEVMRVADGVPQDGMILDVGPETLGLIRDEIDRAKTLVWNGPLGAFEVAPFDAGTVAAARHAAERTEDGELLSVAGGGDTVAALNRAGVADRFAYVSTAGGAFLEWLEGRTLPGVRALAR